MLHVHMRINIQDEDKLLMLNDWLIILGDIYQMVQIVKVFIGLDTCTYSYNQQIEHVLIWFIDNSTCIEFLHVPKLCSLYI